MAAVIASRVPEPTEVPLETAGEQFLNDGAKDSMTIIRGTVALGGKFDPPCPNREPSQSHQIENTDWATARRSDDYTLDVFHNGVGAQTLVFPMDQPNQELPADAVYEILTSLPMKTLSRFRCICKTWNSLISSSRFKQDHHRRSQQNPLLLLINLESNDQDNTTFTFHLYTCNKERTQLRKLSIPVPRSIVSIPQRRISATQSCEGFICLCYKYGKILNILVCNPSTEELVYLPPRSTGYTSYIGFGYAASINEFKVARFFRPVSIDNHIIGNIKCEVFNFGTSCWRKAKSPPYRFSPLFHLRDLGSAPYFNGALHLLPESKDENFIAAFDLESEEYRMIPLPGYYWEGQTDPNIHGWVSFADLGGSLGLTFNRCGNVVEIWLLKDYDIGKWVKQYTIDLSSMISKVIAEPLVIKGHEYILLNVCPKSKVKEMLCYNPHEKKITHTIVKNYWSAMFYVESFLSLRRR